MSAPNPHPEEPRIVAYLDGALSPAEADQVRDHCEICEPCRQILREFVAVHEMLQAYEPATPLRAAWPAVAERRERGRRPVFRPAFAAATAAMAVAGVVLGLLVGSAASRPTVSKGAYLWEIVSSSVANDGGEVMPDIYSTVTTGEGR
jgi:anti-sigma factor RsiW